MGKAISPSPAAAGLGLHNFSSFAFSACPVNFLPLDVPECLPAFTDREFRDALGQFATGVTVVTACEAQGRPAGMTVSSFNSVSLTPPLVLWSLARSAGNFAAYAQCRHYAIHVLAADQKQLALQFSQRGIDRFAGVHWAPNAHGVPLLSGALAVFECQARSRYDEGDHVIMVGEVQACRHSMQAAPLLYHRGAMRGE